ncbi:hypothetical protein [Streptomyces sp. NPDC048462]|uniref:hypothetical protein n=1 Tax=Streptomyces sp. NPDC048462 TaxID=3365555 RepID=UPI00371F031D
MVITLPMIPHPLTAGGPEDRPFPETEAVGGDAQIGAWVLWHERRQFVVQVQGDAAVAGVFRDLEVVPEGCCGHV